jgi:hypothetical protein
MPSAALPTFDYEQTLRGRFCLPTRMTVLPLAEGQLALVSPIPIDDALARRLGTLGEVQYLIAPNMLHDLYVAAAQQRYPRARLLAPSGFAQRHPDLRVDGTLDADLPEALTAAVDVVHFAGAKSVDEYVFFHRATRTLVVTDLVFNIIEPRGFMANVVLFLVGCHERFGQSRSWRFFIKDRTSAARTAERLLQLPFTTLVMAHGQIVREHAQTQLADALRWLLPHRTSLPAISSGAG